MKLWLAVACLLLALTVQTVMALPDPDTFRVKQLPYGRVYDLTWSPDGRTLAVGAKNGVYLLDANYEQIAFLPGEQAEWRGVVWNHDGTRLAVTNSIGDRVNRKCYLSLWEGTEIEQRLPLCGSPIWGHHSDWFAVVGGDQVALWHIEDDSVERQEFQPATNAVFSPDDRFLAYGNAENDFTVWNLGEGAVEFTMLSGGESVSWSSDGQYLLTTISTGGRLKDNNDEGPPYIEWRAFNAIYLWRVDHWYDRAMIEVDDDYDVRHAYSADGQYIFSPCIGFFPQKGGTANICVYQREIKDDTSQFRLISTDYGYRYEASPNQLYYTAWHWCGVVVSKAETGDEESSTTCLNSYNYDGSEFTTGNSLSIAIWSSDSQFVTATDGEGWLYQFDIDQLDFGP
jgi:hypothetical protein